MSDEDVSENEDLNNQFFNMKLNQGGEEFKMHEDDDDQTDLLAEKKQGTNINDFYAMEELNNLKDQIRINMPNMNSNPGMPGGGATNNNTMVTENDAIEAPKKQQIGGGTFNNNLIKLPGLTD